MLTDLLNRFKKLKNKSAYPTTIIEESFMLGGKEGETRFRISFEVPVPIAKNADKKEKEELRQITDETFRPIVVVLKHYLQGLSVESSSERFLMGRSNLIDAIKQCAAVQKKAIEEAEKNR